MNENELKLWTTVVRWVAAIILMLIVTIAIYNYIDETGPLRPKQTMQYYWPR